MKRPNAVQSDRADEGVHRGLILFGRGERVARREEMASVQADAEPLRPLDPAEDGGQMFDRPAKARPLTGGVLHEKPGPQPGGLLSTASIARMTLRSPAASLLPTKHPGWVTTYPKPSSSARWSSSTRALTDFRHRSRSGLAKSIRYESWATGATIPDCSTAWRNRAASSGAIGLARH